MQYYVIGPDGNKYGPADVPTLKQWIAENRIGPQSMLEDFNTGQRMPASSVPGLIEGQPTATPVTGTMAPGTTMGAATGNMYQNAPTMQGGYTGQGAYDNGSNDLTWAWVCGVLGFLCCPIIFIFGFLKANAADQKGNPGAKAARTFNIVMVCVWAVIAVIRVITVVSAIQNGHLGQPPFNP